MSSLNKGIDYDLIHNEEIIAGDLELAGIETPRHQIAVADEQQEARGGRKLHSDNLEGAVYVRSHPDSRHRCHRLEVDVPQSTGNAGRPAENRATGVW